MSDDARFEDVKPDRPLRLMAADTDDLEVISAMVQDAVLPVTEMKWEPRYHRFSLLLNRFRWEDKAAAEAQKRPYERVQSLLTFDGVLSVSSQGIDRDDADMILSLLEITFEAAEAPAGRVILTLAGDGAIGLQVECLDVALRDVTRPYIAPSKRAPSHK